MRANSLSNVPPRLDTPDRLFLWPRERVMWFAAGLFLGPAIYFVSSFFGGDDELTNGYFLLFCVAVLALCTAMAVWRPGGLNVAQWVAVLVDYALRPKRSVWWKE